jgi:hypothetical protein
MWFRIIITDCEGVHRLVSVQANDAVEAAVISQDIYAKWKEEEEKGGE